MNQPAACVAIGSSNTIIIDSKVIPIYPVRYAYANFFGDSLAAAKSPPALSKLLNNTNISEGDGYIARLLRPGWVYIKEEAGGSDFHVFKYERACKGDTVEERYPKFLFRNKKNAQGGLVQDTSGANGNGYPFVFVGKKITEISIAYSEHEWHPDVIDKMNGDAGARSQAMQVVTLEGNDDATLDATEQNIKTLIEDYREQQARLLALEQSTGSSPGQVGLDALTTQESFDLPALNIALELRCKTDYGKVAKIVGLYDPVGRQKDLAEIITKLALWEKSFAAENVYPFTIGQYVERLKNSANDDVSEVIEESINWSEYNTYWKNVTGNFENFKSRQEKLTKLYSAFMNGPDYTGQLGSLDTYFKSFFCNPENQQEAEVELEKLCDILEGVYAGVISSEIGRQSIESIIADYNNKNNVYNCAFETIIRILTTPQSILDWGARSAKAIDKLYVVLGALWGKLAAAAIDAKHLSYKAFNKLSFNAMEFTVAKLIPKLLETLGIKVIEGQVRLTHSALANVLADHINEGIKNFPGKNAGNAITKAEAKLKYTQKLFDWGERLKNSKMPVVWKLSQVEVVPTASSRYQFVKPKNFTQAVGIVADGSFAGLSGFFNVKTIYDVFSQSEYNQADPLKSGNWFHSCMSVVSAVTALTVDALTVSRSALGISAYSAAKISQGTGSRIAGAIAPALKNQSKSLLTVLGGRVASGLIAAANLAGAIAASFDAYRSYQQGNVGQAAGYALIAIGSGVLFAQAALAAGTAAAAGGTATSWTGVGAVVAVGGLITLAVGGVMVWVYGKSDFQSMLENCFWGAGDKYLFWDKEGDRGLIENQIEKAKGITNASEPEMAKFFAIETQEFNNYFYMPSLKIIDNEPLVDFSDDEENFLYQFSLPGFQAGISEIVYEAYEDGYFSDTKDSLLNQKFKKAMEDASFSTQNGITTVTVIISTDKDFYLDWYYKPTPNIITPMRYIDDGSLNLEGVIGMRDEGLK